MEYVDTNLKLLSADLSRSFVHLRNHLSKQDKSGNILLLYRGEELQNVSKKLILNYFGAELPDIAARAFYFGDKARFFAVDNGDRNFLTGINDCSDETLVFIFDRISGALNAEKISRQTFENTSKEFREFFINPKNRSKFLVKVNKSYTPETKLKVRDYFLYFLHVAGTSGVRNETMFVSTSTEKRVARRFTRYVGENRSRIIFHYFIPMPFHIHAIAPWVADHHQNIVYEIGLPTYKPMGLFPKQREVSVKGALFPHFILGIELVDERKFIVNSNFYGENSTEFERISKFGFSIDQSDFKNRIFTTGYIRWGETDLAGNFESYDV